LKYGNARKKGNLSVNSLNENIGISQSRCGHKFAARYSQIVESNNSIMAKGLFGSSLMKKFWMSLAGLFLISFLVVHCAVNAAIFFNDDGTTCYKQAHFMGRNISVSA